MISCDPFWSCIFIFCKILVLIFQDLIFAPCFPICVWGRTEECQIGENCVGHWERENSSHEIKLAERAKMDKWCGSDVHQWQNPWEAGTESWPGHLTQETTVLWPKRDKSGVVNNPSMKSEVDKISKVEGKKFPGFVNSTCLLPAEALAECSSCVKELVLQKWRLSSSGIGRNWERIVFLLITTVAHFLSALWILYFSCSVPLPSLLSCLSSYKDKSERIAETRRLSKLNDLTIWKLF